MATDPRARTPDAGAPPANKPKPGEDPQHQHLDEEIDEELDDTFPASDPLPWSHEVK